jgi:hypothetical protein
MNKASMVVLVSFSLLTGAAYAQETGVRESTDPAKAADVEQRAQALQAQQQSMPSSPMKPAKKHPHKKEMQKE